MAKKTPTDKIQQQIESPPELRLPPDTLPYASGYRKPPEHTKFAKGKSGNPKGRPRKLQLPELAENIVERMYRELCATAVVNGKEVRISGFEAACRGLIRTASSGDAKTCLKAIGVVFEQERQLMLEEVVKLGIDPKEAVKPFDKSKHTGGLLFVPAIAEVNAWQKEAMAQQAKIKRELRDPHHGEVRP